MPKSQPIKSFFRSKPFLGALFCVWATGAISMVSLLTREECDEQAIEAQTGTAQQPIVAAPGWTVHHQLVAGDAVSEVVAKHLIARRPIPGVEEDIRLLGSESRLENRLAAAGWRVSHEPKASNAQPRLSVTAPDGQVAWEGGFSGGDLREGKGAILDRILIAHVVSGQHLTNRIVPYGCAVPPPTSTRSF